MTSQRQLELASFGQHLFLVPALDVIIVRNGNTPAERDPHVAELVQRIISLFREA